MRWYLVLLTLVAFAAEAPVITDAQKAAFWKAQAEALAAKARLDEAVSTLRQQQEALVKTCGTYQLTVDAKGDPICAEKKP